MASATTAASGAPGAGPPSGPSPGRPGGGLRRSSAAMLLGHGGRAALAGLAFLVVARALGADGFGAVAAVMAVGALVGPFASLGAVHLLVRAAVRDPARTAAHYAAAVATTAAGGLAATLLATAVVAQLLPQVPVAAALGVLAAELVGALLVEVAAGAQLARGRALAAAASQLVLHGARLAGALALLAADELRPGAFTAGAWAGVVAATSLAAAAGVVLAVRRDVGAARPALREQLGQWRDGLHFSVGLGSQALSNDLDKAMLARLGTLADTGAYTAAYRVVDVAMVPLRALLSAAYPRFFAAGADGLDAALVLVRRLAAPALGWGALAGAALVAGAGLLPVLLGPSYAPAVGALRWLALLPLLKAAGYLAADALTGAGHQRVRSGYQLGAAGGAALLNLWLIPAHGLAGAVASSLVCDAALAAGLWAVVVRRRRSAQGRARADQGAQGGRDVRPEVAGR